MRHGHVETRQALPVPRGQRHLHLHLPLPAPLHPRPFLQEAAGFPLCDVIRPFQQGAQRRHITPRAGRVKRRVAMAILGRQRGAQVEERGEGLGVAGEHGQVQGRLVQAVAAVDLSLQTQQSYQVGQVGHCVENRQVQHTAHTQSHKEMHK